MIVPTRHLAELERNLTRLTYACRETRKLGGTPRFGARADGSHDGEWHVCFDQRHRSSWRPPCSAFSFGLGGDWSFEEALANATACRVFAFDPTETSPPVHLPGPVAFAPYAAGASDGTVPEPTLFGRSWRRDRRTGADGAILASDQRRWKQRSLHSLLVEHGMVGMGARRQRVGAAGVSQRQRDGGCDPADGRLKKQAAGAPQARCRVGRVQHAACRRGERGGEAAIARTVEESAVLEAQAALYAALSTADAAAVAAMCAAQEDAEVSALAAGGRLDPWSALLADGATAGVALSGADASVVEGGREAFSTGLELLATGDTLLCTQRWARSQASRGAPTAGEAAGEAAVAGEGAGEEAAGEAAVEWRLLQHRTIPYMVQTDAGAALRCDRRGCVGLQRSGLRGAPGMPGDGMS